jgi:hypothetical protein
VTIELYNSVITPRSRPIPIVAARNGDNEIANSDDYARWVPESAAKTPNGAPMPASQKFLAFTRGLLIVVLVVGILVYGFFMVQYVLRAQPGTWVLTGHSPSYMFALPICALTAFGIVAVLDAVTPQSSATTVDFTAFGLKFSGPAGPVTLWVVVYLTLVCSIRLIGESSAPTEQAGSAPSSSATSDVTSGSSSSAP